MRSKTWLVLISFLVWGAGSTYWYVCKIKGFCTQTELVKTPEQSVEKTETKQETKKKLADLLSFNWSDEKPVVRDNNEWTAEVKSIAQLKAEGKKLLVQGPYYADETNNTSFENLGLARAAKVKALFAKELDPELIVTEAKLIEAGTTHPNIFSGYKSYVHWVVRNDFVKEINGKTLIHFPFNSAEEIKTPEILNYLSGLQEQLKANPNQKLSIIGYTDNIGKKYVNKYLGMIRAKKIRKILTKNGIAKNRISISSEGENNPIADNNTKEGRSKNRRVEISIIK